MLIALFALAILAYNLTTFSSDWNEDVFGRTLGDRIRQFTAFALAIPPYFFPWDKVRALPCPLAKWSVIWVFGYTLHTLMVSYYTLALFLSALPMPSVVFDNLLLLYTIVTTVIFVWLD